MRVEINKLLKILLIILIVYLCSISIGYLSNILKYLLNLSIPFVLGFGISFILQPVIKFFEKRGMSHKASIIITLFFLLIIIVSFLIFIAPIISKQLIIFMEKIPSYLTLLEEKIDNLETKYQFLGNIGLSLDNLLSSIKEYQGNIMERIITIIESIFSYFVPVIVTPVLIIYFTLYYEKIENLIIKISSNKPALYNILKKSKKALNTYFKSFFIIITVLTIVASIAFGILGIEYFILWGIVIGITDIIPYIGPYIGGGIVLLFVLTTNPNLFIYTLIIICCIQVLEGCFLTPKIQGKAMQINPILVIFSVIFFGKVLGIFGMLIAVPIVRIIQIIFEEFILRKKVKKIS